MSTTNKKTIEEVMSTLLFHGTSETIIGDLKGGAFDNILWTADYPAVAQNYIPLSGIISYLSAPSSYQLEETIRPTGLWSQIAIMAGYEPHNLEYDSRDNLSSWSWKENKRPLYKDLVSFVEKELGYEVSSNGCYELKTSYKEGKEVVFHSSYKRQGELYLLSGKENLKVFDYASGRDIDLMDVDYLQFNVFNVVKKEGFDAIRINDVAQSKNWGNVGHTSIGIFPEAISKLTVTKISATNFDWEDDVLVKLTPEFIKWYQNNY